MSSNSNKQVTDSEGKKRRRDKKDENGRIKITETYKKVSCFLFFFE